MTHARPRDPGPARGVQRLTDPDELNYLNEALSQPTRSDPEELPRLVSRFAELLTEAGPDDGSIVLQGHWALLHALRGNPVEEIAAWIRAG